MKGLDKNSTSLLWWVAKLIEPPVCSEPSVSEARFAFHRSLFTLYSRVSHDIKNLDHTSSFNQLEAAALALGVLALSMDGDVGVLGPLTLNPERLGTDDFEGTDEELLFRLFWDEEVWNWSDSRGMKNAFGCGNRWWWWW
ncbi:hypothetical protein FXO38_27056 [Capsicum annuum]|nr:hypothetical protein FXO38_27056 [Capsicum annuum]